jgi:hypothetical protein
VKKVAASAVLLVSLASAAAVRAADCVPIAHVTNLEGQVSIKPAGKVVKRSAGKTPSPLCAGDEIHTFQGRALIKSDQDQITLDRDSVLLIKSQEQASVSRGKVLFDIQKRGTSTGLQVATRLSVIGVKGTSFLVADKGSGVSVALAEGVVDVASTQGQLGHYREKPAAAKEATFEDFKREGAAAVDKEKQAFAAYKDQVQCEFVAYVENITMEAGTELEISGQTAVERKTGAELGSDLQALRTWRASR